MVASRRSSGAHSSGPRFGNYKLIALLGEGGFANVYLGKHIYLHTFAAVKILREDLVGADVHTFLNEAQFAAQLKHPHIMPVRDFGLQGSTPFLVMDHASNGTVRQKYRAGTQLPPKVVIDYVEQIASAVQYLHDRRLIHRDIKPENLLLEPDDNILLSDFGIAITTHTTMTNDQECAGTVAYMAPEQIKGRTRRASDQYALGVVVYEWLCGERPFQGSKDEIIRQHLYIAPPSLRKKVPTISRAVEKVVLRALAKNPKDRFESVRAFADALRGAFEEKKMRKVRRQKTWKEIANLYTIDLLVGAAFGGILGGLHMAPSLLEALLALCMVLLPLVGAHMRNNRPLFFLTWSLVITAAIAALLFHSFLAFIVVYISLVLLSLLIAFGQH